MSIDIANESGVAFDEAALAAVARHVLDRLRIHPLAELSILLVGEDAIADLHQRWMGEPGPTDVLAFPMDELRSPHLGGSRGASGGHEPEPVPSLLGDVVLCPQIAAKQAQAQGHSTEDEIELLCVHGILHLLGYDHADPEDHATMFGLQDELLASWRAAGPDAHEAGGGSHGDGPGVQGGAGSPGEAQPTAQRAGAQSDSNAAEPSGEVSGGREGPG